MASGGDPAGSAAAPNRAITPRSAGLRLMRFPSLLHLCNGTEKRIIVGITFYVFVILPVPSVGHLFPPVVG